MKFLSRFFGGADSLNYIGVHQILYSFRKCLYTVYDLSKVNYVSRESFNKKKKIFKEFYENYPNNNTLMKHLMDSLTKKCIIRCIQVIA